MIQSNSRLKILLGMGILTTLPAHSFAALEDSIMSAPVLNFFTQYDSHGAISSATITVYNRKNERQSMLTIEPTLPTGIKKALFSPVTQNSFKKAYAVFYTKNNFNQLQKCSFAGANFNIDDNPKTEEWYVTTSATSCMKEQENIDGVTTHNWIIQRDESGEFRVLMESDKTLLIGPTTPQSPYKPLTTYHNIQRFMPQSTLECGDAFIQWRYNNTKKQYQYTYNRIAIGKRCNGDLAFDTISDPGYKKAVTAITKITAPWVKNNLPAFR